MTLAYVPVLKYGKRVGISVQHHDTEVFSAGSFKEADLFAAGFKAGQAAEEARQAAIEEAKKNGTW